MAELHLLVRKCQTSKGISLPVVCRSLEWLSGYEWTLLSSSSLHLLAHAYKPSFRPPTVPPLPYSRPFGTSSTSFPAERFSNVRECACMQLWFYCGPLPVMSLLPNFWWSEPHGFLCTRFFRACLTCKWAPVFFLLGVRRNWIENHLCVGFDSLEFFIPDICQRLQSDDPIFLAI